MNLPKKKFIDGSGHDYSLLDMDYFGDKTLEYVEREGCPVVLDSEGMNVLADTLEENYSLYSAYRYLMEHGLYRAVYTKKECEFYRECGRAYYQIAKENTREVIFFLRGK